MPEWLSLVEPPSTNHRLIRNKIFSLKKNQDNFIESPAIQRANSITETYVALGPLIGLHLHLHSFIGENWIVWNKRMSSAFGSENENRSIALERIHFTLVARQPQRIDGRFGSPKIDDLSVTAAMTIEFHWHISCRSIEKLIVDGWSMIDAEVSIGSFIQIGRGKIDFWHCRFVGLTVEND